MKKVLTCVVAAVFAVGVVSASETVSFTNVPSQGEPGMVTYNATLVGGYDLNSIDWEGFAATIQDYTYGSELMLDLSGPLGSATIQLGSGSSYAPGATFAGTSYDFTGDPVGDWTFDFYESYDDGNDDLPDATWEYIDFLFSSDEPEPPDATEIAVPSQTVGNIAGAGVIDWYMYTIGSTLDMDMWTEGTALPDPIGDTELGLYDADGYLIANNDDGGPGGGYYSQILETLDAGTYYLAVGGYNTSFDSAGWGVTGGSATGDYILNVTPEPTSLVLLALGGLALLRRR